jgi:hypothetical protein
MLKSDGDIDEIVYSNEFYEMRALVLIFIPQAIL